MLLIQCSPSLFKMGIFDRFSKKSLNMTDAVDSVSKDSNGNFWYRLSSAFDNLFVRGNSVEFDMTNPSDKAKALRVCTPLATTVDRIGKMFSNARIYVVDKDGNEQAKYKDVVSILNKPNPLQTRKSFLKEIERNLTVFGYCPIFTVRATKKLPKAMWCIPPELFTMVPTGKLFRQYELREIIKEVYVMWNGEKLTLADEDYFLIVNSEMRIQADRIVFNHVTDSLSTPVTLWMSAAAASKTLIVNGGPKGIIYNKSVDDMGNATMSPKEKDSIESDFKKRYGLVNKMYQILVTRNNIGWIPLDYDSSKLKLHEEDARCTEKIANALSINPSIFNESKYENQRSALKAAYQDLIIPDSEIISEAITSAICEDGVFIKLDYSHIECLQADKSSAASTIKSASDAFGKLVDDGLITKEEARKELANYIDIDPENPIGEFKGEEKNGSKE